MEYPIRTIVLDNMSNLLPSLTAFLIPRGILTAYTNIKDHNPSVIDTGSLLKTKSPTL